MKYENLKKKVAKEAYAAVMHGANMGEILADLTFMDKPIPPREAIEECANLTYDTIMGWDIRCVGKLRELFPRFFPKSLSKGQLVCDMNEDGDWIVLKA